MHDNERYWVLLLALLLRNVSLRAGILSANVSVWWIAGFSVGNKLVVVIKKSSLKVKQIKKLNNIIISGTWNKQKKIKRKN